MFREVEIYSPSHTKKIFDPETFEVLVEKTVAKVKQIQEKHPEIDTLAACGHSGLMLMGAVAYRLRMNQIAVRKSQDTYHDSTMVNGYLGGKGYLILDDLVSSGATVTKIISRIQEAVEHYNSESGWRGVREVTGPRPVAIALYESCWGNERRTFVVSHNYGEDEAFPLPVYSVTKDHLDLPQPARVTQASTEIR